MAAGGSPYDGSDAYTYFAPLSLLLAPFAHADAVGVLKGWTVLGLGAFTAALALTVWALRDRLGAPWQAPVVFTAGAVIGLHSWPLVYELFLGNDDLLVLLGVVVAAVVWRTDRPVWFGDRGRSHLPDQGVAGPPRSSPSSRPAPGPASGCWR